MNARPVDLARSREKNLSFEHEHEYEHERDHWSLRSLGSARSTNTHGTSHRSTRLFLDCGDLVDSGGIVACIDTADARTGASSAA